MPPRSILWGLSLQNDSGRSFGRQVLSTSVMVWEMIAAVLLDANARGLRLMKCKGYMHGHSRAGYKRAAHRSSMHTWLWPGDGCRALISTFLVLATMSN